MVLPEMVIFDELAIPIPNAPLFVIRLFETMLSNDVSSNLIPYMPRLSLISLSEILLLNRPGVLPGME